MLFATVDVLDGRDIYKSTLDLYESGPLSDRFYQMDFEDKSFINNSGSFFIIIVLIMGFKAMLKVTNKICTWMPTFEISRRVGIFVTYYDHKTSIKNMILRLSIEMYFELTLCCFVGMVGLKEFLLVTMNFSFLLRPSNIICASIGMVMTIYFVTLPFYAKWLIKKEFNSENFSEDRLR